MKGRWFDPRLLWSACQSLLEFLMNRLALCILPPFRFYKRHRSAFMSSWKTRKAPFKYCPFTILCFQVIINVILNLAGVCIAIAAIALYSINITEIGFWWMCDHDYRYYEYSTPPPSPQENELMERCLEGKELVLVSVENVMSAARKVAWQMSAKKRASIIL